MTMYQVYSLTDDGFEQSLGYYHNEDDAEDALDECGETITVSRVHNGQTFPHMEVFA